MIPGRDILLALLPRFLRPLVRLGLIYSCSFQDFVKAMKIAFVEEAAAQLQRSGGKVNTSQLSAMSGMNRNDVAATVKHAGEELPGTTHYLTRVIGIWQSDRRFVGKSGRARVLTCIGDGCEFWKLVKSVSAHLNPTATLRELERLNAVETSDKGTAKLIIDRLTVRNDLKTGLELLAGDLDIVTSGVLGNLSNPQPVNLHIRTEYDNVVADKLPLIRRWLIREGKLQHKRFRNFIGRFDRDISPSAAGKGRAKIAVVTASFGEPDDKD